MFKWYWLYKKSVTKKENAEENLLQLCSFISRNSPSKKISLLPFKFFFMAMSFGECD